MYESVTPYRSAKLFPSGVEFSPDLGDGAVVQHPGRMWEHDLFLYLNVFLVEMLELLCIGSQSLFVFLAQGASRDPCRVESFDRLVQIVGVAMVVFKLGELLDIACGGFRAEPGKQRLLLVSRMPLPAHAKVLERRLHGFCLFIRQGPALRTVDHDAKYVEKLLDPAMAINQHSDGVSNPLSGFAPMCIAIIYLRSILLTIIAAFQAARRNTQSFQHLCHAPGST